MLLTFNLNLSLSLSGFRKASHKNCRHHLSLHKYTKTKQTKKKTLSSNIEGGDKK